MFQNVNKSISHLDVFRELIDMNKEELKSIYNDLVNWSFVVSSSMKFRIKYLNRKNIELRKIIKFYEEKGFK